MGAMKGACDGGLHIPHSVKKFPGFSKTEENKKGEYVAEVHKDRILGCHIDEYMEKLKSESDENYNKQVKYTDKAKTLIKTKGGKTYFKARRLTYDQRKANVALKLKIARGQE